MPSIAQLEFAKALSGKSQCQIILERLQESRGQWVSVIELHQLSGSMAVHSRINDLRAQGHEIENHTWKVEGKTHSEYRWTGLYPRALTP